MLLAPWRFRSGLIGLLVVMVSTGCSGLTVKKQTWVAAFPKDRDEVKCLLIYEDFDVFGKDAKDLENAKKELKELTTGKSFKPPLWPGWFSLEAKPTEAEEKQFVELIRKHVQLENGKFFVNDDKQLAFWQRLTIRDAQALVKGCNELISAALGRLAKEGLALDRARLSAEERRQWERWDVETLKLVEQAAKGGHSWLKLEPGRLSFTMPGSEHYFRHLKRDLMQPLSSDQNAFWLEWFTQNPWSVDQRKNDLTLSLGVGQHEPIHLTTNTNGSPRSTYQQALLTFSRTLPVPVVKTTTKELVADLMNEVKQGK
jgi:hypothetical protein